MAKASSLAGGLSVCLGFACGEGTWSGASEPPEEARHGRDSNSSARVARASRVPSRPRRARSRRATRRAPSPRARRDPRARARAATPESFGEMFDSSKRSSQLPRGRCSAPHLCLMFRNRGGLAPPDAALAFWWGPRDSDTATRSGPGGDRDRAERPIEAALGGRAGRRDRLLSLTHRLTCLSPRRPASRLARQV